MATSQTYDRICRTAKQLFAERGYDGLSMRVLSKESGIGLSSIYHFFADKDVLLRTIYDQTNHTLGESRSATVTGPTTKDSLQQVINFQFDHIEDIVFVLKYYLHFRADFAALPTKTLPPKSTLHIEEILRSGVATGELQLDDESVVRSSKVIAHTINGFLLEYYPARPDDIERQTIVYDIVNFSLRSLARR